MVKQKPCQDNSHDKGEGKDPADRALMHYKVLTHDKGTRPDRLPGRRAVEGRIPQLVFNHLPTEDPPKSRTAVQKCAAVKGEEEEEMPVVDLTHALVQPAAVMVEARLAHSTQAAMLRPCQFHDVACGADSPCDVNDVVWLVVVVSLPCGGRDGPGRHRAGDNERREARQDKGDGKGEVPQRYATPSLVQVGRERAQEQKQV